MAIIASALIAVQNYCLAVSSETLVAKLRSKSFRAILRADISYFDEEKNSTGALTSGLADNAQKISGLAGVVRSSLPPIALNQASFNVSFLSQTLGTIIQSFATVVAGMIIGLIYGWKLALIGIACMPLIISAGYIRLRLVVLKDQKNKVDRSLGVL
jgi:ATP-binding cassette subfamily B (MDR/TAP) protein 1